MTLTPDEDAGTERAFDDSRRGRGRIPGRDVSSLGQVFTPPEIVKRMLALKRNSGRVLEPACGDGAFLRELDGALGIELDPNHCPSGALNMDFFSYPTTEKFDTVIGNPPYVRYQDIRPDTRRKLEPLGFDGRSNLYLFFIRKAALHLNPGGELVFITPREFLKATSSRALNAFLHEEGTITDLIDLGDARIFDGAIPNCVIWRFVRGDFSHRLTDGREFVLCGGQLLFTRSHYPVRFSDVFHVKVGAVSGADDIFSHCELGNADFVCSHTVRTGQTRRMIYNRRVPHLDSFKRRLLARRVAKFDESNWWRWGRSLYESDRPRIYVNHKTRAEQPFFLHSSNFFDGAVLAIFPHALNADLARLCDLLNSVDWSELGFLCDGRYIFGQRSLETAVLPAEFSDYAISPESPGNRLV